MKRNAWPLSLLTVLIILTLCLGPRAAPAAPLNLLTNNLLTNGDFAAGVSAAGVPEGWAPFWSRQVGMGSMALDAQTRHDGHPSLRVVHTGVDDWSMSQAAPLPATPGGIYRLSGWVRCEKAGGAELSMVTRDGKGGVLDWSYSPARTSGTHDWQLLSRRFVVPAGCATTQFRMIGLGSGTVWLSDAALVQEGMVPSTLRGKTLRLTSQALDVRLAAGNGTLAVLDRRTGRTWRQGPPEAGLIVRDAHPLGPRSARLTLWDVANDLTLRVTVTLAADAPELTVTLAGDGPAPEPVTFPPPFVTGHGTALVVPLNEGILYPVDDASIPPISLVTYSGHGLCMPWVGVTDTKSGAGVMAILRTPDDAHIEITRRDGGDLFALPAWEGTRGRFGYARSLTYVFFPKGGYVAQAKRYRAYAKATGLFKTLVQKRRENPNVDKLIGAVNVWTWEGDKVALCREMKALGMDRVLWSNGGLPKEVAAINALGYLTSRYDIFQDVYPPDAPAWTNKAGWPQDLVWLPNGDWMKGWADIQKKPDGTQIVYQGGVINSERGLARARQTIPADLKTTPFGCRFIDTTTASPWREDYNPAHPLTRSQDRHYKMALLHFCSGQEKLVVGTETGIDPSVPFVDYYEGMMSLGPYRLPDSGRDLMDYKTPTPDFLKFQVGSFYRIPLWELVYHDCVVAGWYWGDSTNKEPEAWDKRDQFNSLYGTPPLFLFDKAVWEKNKAHFARTYRTVCPLVRRLGYDEMLSHAFLTPDHTVQQTRWASGATVTVNFGGAPYTLRPGVVIPAGGRRVD